MAITAINRDFIVKAGALVQGTNFVTSSTGQTGTLQVNGGAAIAKNLVVGTTATIWGATTLQNTLTVGGYTILNAAQAAGFTATSISITNNLTVGGNGQITGLFTATGAATLGNTLSVAGNAQFSGGLNTFSGALFVTGTNIFTVGTGAANFGGTVGIAGVTNITNNTTADISAGGTGALRVTGGVYIGDDLMVNSTAYNTATSTANAIYTAGGIFADKGLTVNGPALFKGNVTFSGTATNVYSTNTVYTDNLINMHVPSGSTGDDHNWTSDDGKDIGFVFHYYKAADKNAFLGFANDSSYLEWYDNGTETGGVFTGTSYGTFKTGDIRLVGTTNATSTITGAFQVAGGAGIGLSVYAGGNISGGTLTGRNLTTASNFLLSDASGNIVNSPINYNYTTSRIVGTVDNANTATNIVGGASGSLVYQSAAGVTTTLPIGTTGQ
jgi:hypothetical protein